MRTLLVFAPNFRICENYINWHGKPLGAKRDILFQNYKWVYVNRIENVAGFANGTDLIWIRGDKQGDLPFPTYFRDVIYDLCRLDAMGIINIKLRTMEQPP